MKPTYEQFISHVVENAPEEVSMGFHYSEPMDIGEVVDLCRDVKDIVDKMSDSLEFIGSISENIEPEPVSNFTQLCEKTTEYLGITLGRIIGLNQQLREAENQNMMLRIELAQCGESDTKPQTEGDMQ
jgi:hypothetical protein